MHVTKFLTRCRRAKMRRLLKEILRRRLEGRKSLIVNLNDAPPAYRNLPGDFVYGSVNLKFVSPTPTCLRHSRRSCSFGCCFASLFAHDRAGQHLFHTISLPDVIGFRKRNQDAEIRSRTVRLRSRLTGLACKSIQSLDQITPTQWYLSNRADLNSST